MRHPSPSLGLTCQTTSRGAWCFHAAKRIAAAGSSTATTCRRPGPTAPYAEWPGPRALLQAPNGTTSTTSTSSWAPWARPWPTHSMFRAASFQSTLTTSHAELLPFTELSVGHANCHAKDLYHLHCQGEKNKAAVSRSECHHVRLLCQVLMSEPCMVGQAPGYHDLTRPSLWLPLDTCITAHDLVKPALAT